jgi:hypothetical protein
MSKGCVGKSHEPFFGFIEGGSVIGGLFKQSGKHGLKIIIDRNLAQIVDKARR